MMKHFAKTIGWLVLFSCLLFALGSHVPRGPVVVAEQSWTNQTTAIGTTTVYTPDEDGMYRINLYTTVSSGSASYSVNPWVAYTDTKGSQNFIYTGLCFPTGNPAPTVCTLTVFAASGNPIQVHTTISGSVDMGENYDTYVTIEKL